LEQEQPTDAYQPIDDQDEWLQEAELPSRPRRRIISPIPLALLGLLLVACGFIAGVLVEKGQSSSSSPAGSAASLASRLAALRSGAAGAAGSAAASLLGGAGSGGGAGAGARLGPGGNGGATAGSVAYISGDTLYVTTAEGNTVKVTTSAGTAVTTTVKANVPGIHPGETVLVTGTPGANGAISAESIRVGGGLGGGLRVLFGGSAGGGGRGAGGGGRGTDGASRGAGGAKANSEPQLFGPG
jgi:hypothetical protein